MCKQSNNISFLLGAGFSAPAGYPIGNSVNQSVLEFRKQNSYFSLTGKLSHWHESGCNTELGKFFPLFLDTIDYYAQNYSKSFNYEEYFDFLKQEILKSHEYERWVRTKFSNMEINQNLVYAFLRIYNQIIEDIIYPNKNSKLEDYNEFIKWIVKRSKEKIVHIHTLNHDLLLEGELLPDFISDGYQQEGSQYTCRNYSKNTDELLPMYTGIYQKNVRLYKLHGSFDQFIYHEEDGKIIHVKIPNKADFSCIEDNLGHKDISNYHPDFLSGTTSKIQRYKEPYYSKLLKCFEDNIINSEKIIVIGYGGNDSGINKMLADNSHGQKMIVVSPTINNLFIDEMVAAGYEVLALKKTLGEVTSLDFDYKPKTFIKWNRIKKY